MFVPGSLQAWDSNIHTAGLLIVLLVSLALALPPVALPVPVKQPYFVGAIVVSLVLLIVARLFAPIPLPA
jgi:hypothetical protein